MNISPYSVLEEVDSFPEGIKFSRNYKIDKELYFNKDDDIILLKHGKDRYVQIGDKTAIYYKNRPACWIEHGLYKIKGA